METEKTSYTLNNGDEKPAPKSEKYEPLEEDVPAETDKMLADKIEAGAKTFAEVPKEADETTALDEKVEAEKEKEVPNIPAKNRFFQFFEKKKKIEPSEPAAQTGNGTLNDSTAVDGPAAETNPPKRRFIPLKLQNPFAKKSETATPTPGTDEKEKPTTEASSSDEKKGKSALRIEAYLLINYSYLAADSNDDKKTETKFKPLASITFPSFSGIINKFRKAGRSDDIELGSGPGGKAGLASMETLDDSTKDPWNQENGGDAVDAEKSEEAKKAEEATAEEKTSLFSNIRNYTCSIGELLCELYFHPLTYR